MDYIARRILQARILECVAFPFSRGPSQPRGQTHVSWIAGGFFTSWATREAKFGVVINQDFVDIVYLNELVMYYDDVSCHEQYFPLELLFL